MGISSNTLFHFTDKLDVLKQIISDGFKISYCLEETNAFPMISFCDLPISAFKEQKYGEYAIGMSLDWGNKNKLNPVFYFQENSELIDSYRAAHLRAQKHMTEILEKKKDSDFLEEIKPYFQYILDSSRFQKFYQNDLTREEKIYKNYKFYNEREWRFVPNINADYVKNRMSREEYLNYKKKNSKPHIQKYPLLFNFKDIRHIILKSNNEISDFISFLDTQEHLFASKNEVDYLKTRITTTELLSEDI